MVEFSSSEVRRVRAPRHTKRLIEEPKWRNQYISSDLPTLAYVPQIEVDEDSRYKMVRPA